jgi:hypothetical protein
MFQSKWSPEEEKNKLGSRRRKMQEMMRGERNLPRGNMPLLLWERNANLLSFHLFNRFRLRPDSAFSAGACARGGPWFKGAASTLRRPG